MVQDQRSVVTVRWDDPDFLRKYCGFRSIGIPVRIQWSRHDLHMLAQWRIKP